jgi:hypothetical protein
MRSIYVSVVFLFVLSACSSDSKETQEVIPVQIEKDVGISTSNLAIPDNRFVNNYQILMFGNSHTAGLDILIETLIGIANPSKQVNVINIGGGFLDNSSSQQRRIEQLESQPWTHIVLQGQKYSQSGAIEYPTNSAKTWISKAKSLGITPILFPEHPQIGNSEEGKRIHDIHIAISSKQRSCIAPVGLTWDNVIMTEPQLNLHNADGNHASLTGRLLTAYIFYEVITGETADLLPYIDNIDVDASTQQLLKQFASATIQSNTPCVF